MPNLDGTGPKGQGSRTGCGFRPCGNGVGRGFGCRRCGCGRGFGFRRFFSRKNDLATLEDQEKMLVEELNAIREEKASLVDGGK